jgi:hypothetical protein
MRQVCGTAYEGGCGGHDHATGIKVRLIGGLSASWYQPRQIVAFEMADLQIGEDIRWLATGR